MRFSGIVGCVMLLGLGAATSVAGQPTCESSKDCNDNNPCTTDTCVNSLCMHDEIVCDDEDPCTNDICDGTGCNFELIPCDDGNACTEDFCIDGQCHSTTSSCDDGDPCTLDSCVPTTGGEGTECTHDPIVCEDKDPCTVDSCVEGECSFEPISCDDEDPCTIDYCSAGVTTGIVTCNHDPLGCDDRNSCTSDRCDPETGDCIHEGSCDLPLLDIKPGLCPNPVNVQRANNVIVALVATGDFDPSLVDQSTLWLSRTDGVGSAVAPFPPTIGLQDLATPLFAAPCACHTLGPDGVTDLRMKFHTQDLRVAFQLDALAPGTMLPLVLSATLIDGTTIQATDCIEVQGTH